MHCLHPIKIRNPNWFRGSKDFMYLQVPCGHCIACQERRRSEWAFRLEQEAANNPTFFVTLAYNSDNLHYSCNPESGELLPTLYPVDMTLFLKRLRKSSIYPIRFFYCGEYGGRFGRPHYHLILFGLPNLDYVKSKVESCWKLGFTSVEPANIQRFRYVAKYVVKLDIHDLDEYVTKPFARMSRRPGIGYNSLTSDYKSFYKSRLQTYTHLSNGELINLPRYFKARIFSQSDMDIINKRLDYLSDFQFITKSSNFNDFTFLRQDLLDDEAWEKSKIKQFLLHYGK